MKKALIATVFLSNFILLRSMDNDALPWANSVINPDPFSSPTNNEQQNSSGPLILPNSNHSTASFSMNNLPLNPSSTGNSISAQAEEPMDILTAIPQSTKCVKCKSTVVLKEYASHFLSHLQQNANGTYSCLDNFCTFINKNKRDALKHTFLHLNFILQCSDCSMIFRDPPLFKKHPKKCDKQLKTLLPLPELPKPVIRHSSTHSRNPGTYKVRLNAEDKHRVSLSHPYKAKK